MSYLDEQEKGKRRGPRACPFSSSVLVLLLILLVAAALRFYRLNAQSIWFDEGWSIHLAQGTPGEALAQIGSEGHTHPPGYYFLLWAWVRIWGDSVPAVRGLSVLLGVLTVGLVYVLGRALFDRQTGLVAAGLLAISPAHIIYSQETRMYALLAFCFAGLLTLYDRYAQGKGKWSAGHWLALIALEIIAIYTHYFAFLFLFSLAAWLVVEVARRAREEGLRPLWRWAASQLLVALAFVPWLGVALARTVTYAPAGTSTPGPLAFLAQVWSFLMGGHIALYGRVPLFAGLAEGVLLALLLLALLLYWRKSARREVAYLLVQGLVPLALIYVLMRFRPGFHPRYVLMLLIPFLVLAVRVAVVLVRDRDLLGVLSRAPALQWMGKVLGIAFALLWLTATGLAAKALLTDAYYARDNAQGAATYLRAHLGSEAVIIEDMEDWALRYYLAASQAPTILAINGDQAAVKIETQVNRALQGRSQVALVKWYQGETDKRGILPYLLERAGTSVEMRALSAYTVQIYIPDNAPPALVERNTAVDFGPLRLIDTTVEEETPADEAVTIAMTWRKGDETPRDYKVSLRLTDRDGRRAADMDSLLLNSRGQSTRQWTVGQEVTSYHVLPLGAGIAPGSYTLQVGVYDESDPTGLDVLDETGTPKGKLYRLAAVELLAPRGRTHKTLDRTRWGLQPLPEPVSLADGLELRSSTPPQQVIRTGESLSVLLEWHSTLANLPAYRPTLRLLRGEQVLAAAQAAPGYDTYSTDLWQADETVLDWRDLDIPPDTPGGPAELQITLWGEPAVSLGQVQVDAVSHSFTPPTPQVETALSLGDVAELVGYSVEPAEIAAGEPFSLTLHWRALAQPPKGYDVFTHLLNAEGKVIAQHDGAPAGSERPTSSWLAGEFITDQHTLQWVEEDAARRYRGTAIIEVGLYDPENGQRLPTPQGDSRLLLPSSIIVH